MIKDRELFLPCSCGGCGIVGLSYDVSDKADGDEYMYLSYYPNAWYERQSIWRRIWKTIKMIWFILIGKEYLMFDIVLENKGIADLREFMNGLEDI